MNEDNLQCGSMWSETWSGLSWSLHAPVPGETWSGVNVLWGPGWNHTQIMTHKWEGSQTVFTWGKMTKAFLLFLEKPRPEGIH